MDDRRRQILAALAQMDKQFGKGSVLMLGSRAALPVETITTGSISIDNALGAGGFPRGRVIEVFGPESSGKTTLALHVIAEAQRQGGTAAFIDAEHALDRIYAAKPDTPRGAGGFMSWPASKARATRLAVAW